MKFSSILKFTIPIILGGTIFYLVFRNVSFGDFVSRLSEVSYQWVWLSMILSLVSHLLRAYRWNLMLSPLGYELRLDRTFFALMSGYLANLAFPRLGEVTRCAILKRNSTVPVSVGFGSVITERVIDFLILLSLIALDLILEFDKIFEYFKNSVKWDNWMEQKSLIIGFFGVFVASGVFAFLAIRYLLRKDFKYGFLNKIQEKVVDVFGGLSSIRKVQNPLGYVLSTIGIWVLYYLMSYIIFFSMVETSELGLGAGLSILAAAGVSMAMPVQGGIGAYHALVSGTLVIYGLQSEVGLFFATMLHTSQLVTIMIVGGVSLIISLIIPKRTKTENSQ